MTETELRKTVAACIASSLALDESEVQPHSRLIDDLGADSLDFIDILFSLERAVGTKLRNSDIDSFLRADFSEQTLVEGQYIPRAEVERLLAWLPTLSEAESLDRITPRDVYNHITVETFCRIASSAASSENS